MPQLRCPMCRLKFSTSKTEGRVRCPECEELFEPDWGEADEPAPKKRPRDDDEEEDREPRRRRVKSRPRGGTGNSTSAIVVAGLIFFLLFAGGVGYGVYRAFLSKPEFKTFSPPGGRCSILLPGSPKTETQNILGMQTQFHVVERSRGSYGLAWADIPANLPFSLRGAVDGIARSVDGTASVHNSKSVGANGYIEFEIATGKPKGFASGRVMVVRGRFYQFFALGSDSSLSNPDVRKFIDSFKLTDGEFPWDSEPNPMPQENAGPNQPGLNVPPNSKPPNPKPKPPDGGYRPDPNSVSTTREEMLGVNFDPKFEDAAPAGGVLVGLEVGLAPFFDYNIVGTLKPLYRVGGKDVPGTHYGMDEKNGVVTIVAKPGYAVGAITAKTGLGIDGVSVTFMRVNGDRLDPNDAYESNWVGGMGGGNPTKITGNGAPVTGLLVRQGNERVSSVGLKFKGK